MRMVGNGPRSGSFALVWRAYGLVCPKGSLAAAERLGGLPFGQPPPIGLEGLGEMAFGPRPTHHTW